MKLTPTKIITINLYIINFARLESQSNFLFSITSNKKIFKISKFIKSKLIVDQKILV